MTRDKAVIFDAVKFLRSALTKGYFDGWGLWKGCRVANLDGALLVR